MGIARNGLHCRASNYEEHFDAITTWVDRLIRKVHFIPSHSTDSAVDVAGTCFKNIFSPENILSDRDAKFVSKFWKHLMKLCDIQLKMSSSRHPQTDGASDLMNRMIENYLRCYCSHNQNYWDDLLPAAESAYNSAVSEDLGMSPFELDFGWNQKSALDFLTEPETPVKGVDDFKLVLKESLEDAKFSYKVSKARQMHILLEISNFRNERLVIGCGLTSRCSLTLIRSLKNLRS